ncbi:DNA repair helicase XPB [Paenibacillus polymyxa]|uniref:DNA 3'-5' helicase n=1 Tax=Paenibacillus polymyxa (strain SC2) TaxID=886882 RepID=E3E883_PAEPS|nr:DNA repair helicase XPB [Paenibacillus polymyxa]ADO57275.1 helicase [Paenibacillus polymyxa SC2]WPQ55061.1 DNA repair helicase XPB [Paenibacillus polymyxa]CCC86086.1 tFIIH basal transcription factor complex helicase XPB subunit DNA excision repair protein ERCC-3 [Paenibacillus polymyxa M1]
MNPDHPCIVQRDFTVLLEMGLPDSEWARSQLQIYAELVKSPSAFHTYHITPLSLWNAAALGWSAEDIQNSLHSMSRWDIPRDLLKDIEQLVSRYGTLTLSRASAKEEQTYGTDTIDAHRDEQESDRDTKARKANTYTIGDHLILAVETPTLLDELLNKKELKQLGLLRTNETSASVPPENRGLLKQELTRLGYPVVDTAGYLEGNLLRFTLGKGQTELQLRDYQVKAADAFEGTDGLGGSGVLVLPCGAGKTVIGMAVMNRLQCEVLILTSNTISVRQWIEELKQKTNIPVDSIGEYSGQKKEVRPITVATYQILTHRRNKDGEFEHMKLLSERKWGLIIYDEVHLLPAPVFRATADIQATRRLGLTATLVREDGCERDVFSLIGPKRYDMPWKELERQGWIAQVDCVELRLPMTADLLEQSMRAEGRQQYRIAAENPAKLEAVRSLVEKHKGIPTLIIGQYLDQLRKLAQELDVPLITGSMTQSERVRWFDAFRKGNIQTLLVSKVANFAVDLPDAAVAIEVSGSFGSRQEEAQRLGRILRPKPGDNKAYFYALVTENSKEMDFAARRQLFLIEQGYEYAIRRFDGTMAGRSQEDEIEDGGKKKEA